MKKKIVSICPVCGNKMYITALKCSNCHTEVIGDFELDELFKLNEKQLEFVKVFIRNRGNIKEVEKELGISYPTVRNKLDEIIRALGYRVEKTDEIAEKRKEILSKLENGEISSDEAIKLLKSLEY